MPECIVECKPRPRNRVFIKLSGGRFFTIPESEAAPLQNGAALSDDDIGRLSRIDQFFRGRDKAVRLLSLRHRTRHEIKSALDKINIQPAIRDGIIDELREIGLIDDVRFAREYVCSRVEIKQMGPHRLRFELRKLGVHEDIVEDVLGSEITGEVQERAAREIVRKNLGERTPTVGDVRRLSGTLTRKGIDYEVVNRVTYELLQRARSDESFE